MNLSNKENKIKDILSDLQFDLNTEEIWNAVEGDLPKKKKRRIPFWLLGSAIAFIGLLGFIFTQFSIAENGKSDSTINLISENTRTDQAENNGYTDEKEDIKSSEVSTISNFKTIQNQNQINSFSTVESSSITKINYTKNIIADKSKTTSEIIQKESNNAIASKNTNTQFNSNLLSNSLLILSLENINSIELPSLSSPRIKPSLHLLPSITPLIHQQLWKTTFVLRNGINRNISSNTLKQITGEFDQKEFSNEVDLYGYNSEVYIDAYNRSGWTIGTGVSYGKSTTRYKNQEQSVSTTYNNLLQETEIRENDITWHRVHRSADFRMVVRKELFHLNKIKISPELGFGYNLWSDHQGYYFDNTAFPFTPFTSKEENQYKLKNGMDGQLGLMFATMISNWEIGVLPYFRYNPNNIINDNHFYNLKNSQVGLHISVAYKPNWERLK